MTSSVIGQDEPNLALWYPRRHYGAILPAWDSGFVPQGKFIMFWCFIPYNKSFIDQACSQDGWILARSFLRVNSSRPINTQKKNSSDIQSSWPHTWSITHVSFHYSIQRSVFSIFQWRSNDGLRGPSETDVRASKPILTPFALNKNLIELRVLFLTRTGFTLAKFVNFRCFLHFRRLQWTFQNGRPLVLQDFFIPFIFQNNSVPFEPGFVLLLTSTYFSLPYACVRAIVARKVESTSEAETWHLQKMYWGNILGSRDRAVMRALAPANIW